MVETSPKHRSEVGSVTSTVLDEVAKREGVDPLELSPPLSDAIDPDALEALLADSISGERREDIRVDFRYCGYNVAVEGNGEIDISNEERAIK